jgi:2-polyprenyl-3-methyl-5-hydroxy-6-metoxy-1,4-benzoquinol methylase
VAEVDRDREKWNRKYTQKPELLKRENIAKSVEKFYNLAPNSKALDIACGGGRHTIFLADRGFNVDAIDISDSAIEYLKDRVDSSRVNLINSDLDNYQFKKDSYGLILKINFLDRAVIERAKSALVDGGLFIVETYLEDNSNEKANSNPNFLLKKGELREIFKDFEILDYREFDNEPYELYRMKKASIVARKIKN